MNEEWRDQLIKKGAAIDALTEVESHYEFEDGHDHLMRWAKTKIFALPSAQPQRIKGRWVRKESDLSWWYECSECGESPLFDPYEHEVQSPFCPFCGSDMRGDEDETD